MASHSSTLLPSLRDYPRFLATQHLSAHLWGETFVSTAPAPAGNRGGGGGGVGIPAEQLADPGEVREWLHKLLLRILVPSFRR